MTGFLFVTAFTVSIDSFACGFSLAFNGKGKNKFIVALVIALTVFVMCAAANYAAASLSVVLSEKIASLGGIILIGVGVFNLLKPADCNETNKRIKKENCKKNGATSGKEIKDKHEEYKKENAASTAPTLTAADTEAHPKESSEADAGNDLADAKDKKARGKLIKQSLLSGVAVGLDGAAANLSLAIMGINGFYVPVVIAAMHAVMIMLGITLSGVPFIKKFGKLKFLPPLVLILLGLYKLLPLFL